MARQNFGRNDMASFSRLAKANPSMVEETDEIMVSHLANPLHFAARLESTSFALGDTDPNLTDTMNGWSPLHFAAMKGSIETLKEFLDKAPSSFDSVTRGKKETVFHIAARHKKNEAFIFMAKSAKLGHLLYQLYVEENNVFHVAASVGSIELVSYIIRETKIKVTTKNKNGFAAVDLLNEDGEDFILLSSALRSGNFEIQVIYEFKDLKKQIKKLQSKVTPKEEFEMQLEALQSARNTITIVAVLIASVTFTCGINPPGGLYQDKGPLIGTSVAVRTLAFKMFSISNSIALFTSMCMVILLQSIIPYRVYSLRKFLVITHWMMWVAVAPMSSAYVAAASVTLPPQHFGQTKWLHYTTLAIATLTLGGLFVYLQFKHAKCMLKNIDFRKCLSTSRVPNNGSLDMAANDDKGYYFY
ncbi:Ankyrin repeat-containing protein ITN1 [Cardamine amara subsp. amara]|uniref:Ankyrin repeat-containing protein ITN1 n=1 Tax=Cardamine amara subsp. amara TaxID=228776 RepID=A0ABD0ZXH9_CARAN